MNKHITAIVLLSLFFSCCNKMDNYSPPNASISGAILDAKRGDTVPTANNTSQLGYSYPDGDLNIYQQHYSSTAAGPQGTSYSQYGTYSNNSIFAGTYKGLAFGAFYADTVLFTAVGHTVQNFNVSPFLYVTMQILSSTDTSVTITYQAVSNDSTQHVSEASAWLSPSEGVNRFSWYGSNFNPVNKTSYRDDHPGLSSNRSFTRTFSGLTPNTTYYIRAGAVAAGNNPVGYWNYSKVYVLQTGQ